MCPCRSAGLQRVFQAADRVNGSGFPFLDHRLPRRGPRAGGHDGHTGTVARLRPSMRESRSHFQVGRDRRQLLSGRAANQPDVFGDRVWAGKGPTGNRRTLEIVWVRGIRRASNAFLQRDGTSGGFLVFVFPWVPRGRQEGCASAASPCITGGMLASPQSGRKRSLRKRTHHGQNVVSGLRIPPPDHPSACGTRGLKERPEMRKLLPTAARNLS